VVRIIGTRSDDVLFTYRYSCVIRPKDGGAGSYSEIVESTKIRISSEYA
jgi:hypothetical protein